MGRSRSLNKLFAETDGSPLAEVIAKTAKLNSIKEQILDYIPASLRPLIDLAEDNHGTLTLICQSGAVANRIRFMETQLLTQINNDPHLPQLRGIKTVVRSNKLPTGHYKTVKGGRKNRPTMSNATAALIEQTSSAVSNPELAKALKDLAGHRRR